MEESLLCLLPRKGKERREGGGGGGRKLSLTDSKNAFSQICSQSLQRSLCLFSGRNPRQLKTRRRLRRMRLLRRVHAAPSRAFPAWTLKLFLLWARPSSTLHIHQQTCTHTQGHLIVSTPTCCCASWKHLPYCAPGFPLGCSSHNVISRTSPGLTFSLLWE